MIIGGMQKFTLLDYPGKIAAIVFTKGCNLRCPYCHNPEIVDPKKINYEDEVGEEDILNFLRTRKGDLDGVCITGGEPTIQVGLKKFIKNIKDMNFLVKVDTNASNASVVKSLIDEGLVDYWAIDIKTIPQKYKVLGASENVLNNIGKSLSLISESGNKFELRTTVVRGIVNQNDITGMMQWLFSINNNILKGAERYSLQEFRPEKTLNEKYSLVRPYSRNDLVIMGELIKPYCRNVMVISE